MKRLVLKAIAAAAVLATFGVAQAQEIREHTIKFATQNPKGHPMVLGMERFAKRHCKTLNDLLGTHIGKPPSDSTFRLLLAQLDVDGFEALLEQWMAAQPGSIRSPLSNLAGAILGRPESRYCVSLGQDSTMNAAAPGPVEALLISPGSASAARPC